MVYSNLMLSVLPVEEQTTESPETRAVYDGDISSSILKKFVDTYNRDFPLNDKDYVIYRYSQYDYRMYVGDFNGVSFLGETSYYRYYSNTSTYNNGFYWSKSTVDGFTPDLSGYTGYVYSSYDGFPSAGIELHDGNVRLYSFSILILLSLCCLFLWITSLFRKDRLK